VSHSYNQSKGSVVIDMGRFILEKSFGKENDTRRYNIQDLDTPYGPLFVYQLELLEKPEDKRFRTVCFPLIRNLPPENGCDIKEIEDFVPPEHREVIARILLEEGYKGQIKWKPGEA
jgi:hypothetical protein